MFYKIKRDVGIEGIRGRSWGKVGTKWDSLCFSYAETTLGDIGAPSHRKKLLYKVPGGQVKTSGKLNT